MCIFIVSFILLYLDNGRLSSITMIKYIQAFTFISVLFVMLLYINNSVFIDMVSYIKNNYNNNNYNINLHGHRYGTLDKKEVKFRGKGKGLSTVGGQIR